MNREDTANNTTTLFFSLIKCALGNESKLPWTPSEMEWNELYDTAKRQTLLGIAFTGIEIIPKEQRPASELLIKWHHQYMRIRSLNTVHTKKAIAVSEKFKSEGFRNCILKGQGIAQYYPNPSMRTPGDIDIWLEGGSEKVISYVREICPDCKPKYHHVDFPVIEGTDIEIHYRPTWMYNPINNRKLQEFFAQKSGNEFINTVETSDGRMHVPTVAFNMVYIPIHIYRHLFDEGIGMRQILDYYFVIQQPISNKEKEECISTLKRVGVLRFTRALMYVMQQMFGLEKNKMLVEPDKKQGEFLLREIMLAGNFGQHDKRFAKSNRGYNITHFKNQAKRSLMLITKHPSETLCNPLFKIWHTLWRRSH